MGPVRLEGSLNPRTTGRSSGIELLIGEREREEVIALRKALHMQLFLTVRFPVYL